MDLGVCFCRDWNYFVRRKKGSFDLFRSSHYFDHFLPHCRSFFVEMIAIDGGGSITTIMGSFCLISFFCALIGISPFFFGYCFVVFGREEGFVRLMAVLAVRVADFERFWRELVDGLYGVWVCCKDREFFEAYL